MINEEPDQPVYVKKYKLTFMINVYPDQPVYVRFRYKLAFGNCVDPDRPVYVQFDPISKLFEYDQQLV